VDANAEHLDNQKMTDSDDTFKFIAGHAGLDFVNTVSGWISDSERKTRRNYQDLVLNDKLADYKDLVAWSQRAKLLTARESRDLLENAERQPRKATAVFKRALRLRAAAYRILRSLVNRWRPDPSDIEILNQELIVARRHERLIYETPGFSLAWRDREQALDCVLWHLAQSLAELLSSPELSRIRQCGGERCGWMFLDSSRNRSRQWCDMKDCGNRSKVRRFRHRQLHHGR